MMSSSGLKASWIDEVKFIWAHLVLYHQEDINCSIIIQSSVNWR